MALLNANFPATRLALLVITGAFCAQLARAQLEESKVKAAYLYNFAKFVSWPAHAFKGDHAQIGICIFNDSFQDAIEQVVNGKSVGGRAFVVRRVSGAIAASNCQILFVPASEQGRFRSLLASVRGAGVLTVGEIPGFATAGGVINLKLENGRIRFEINVTAADREHLYISSKLLSLADIIKESE